MKNIEKALREYVSPMLHDESEIDEYLKEAIFVIKFNDVDVPKFTDEKLELVKRSAISITVKTNFNCDNTMILVGEKVGGD